MNKGQIVPQFPREGIAGFLEYYCRLVGTELKPNLTELSRT